MLTSFSVLSFFFIENTLALQMEDIKPTSVAPVKRSIQQEKTAGMRKKKLTSQRFP